MRRILYQVARIWIHGDIEVSSLSGDALSRGEQRPVTIDDRALYIYTSGTTGLSKAANVSHGRIMQWTHWFPGMMDVEACDRIYDCLPMYHSVGGVQAPGAVLVGGGSVVIRDKFSASQFWADIERWDCTLFQYIGELCRYLLHTEPSAKDTAHRIRMACGNGLRPEIWRAFQDRFQIPKIFEFYAATEGAVSLFNIEGKPGAIGRVPSYFGASLSGGSGEIRGEMSWFAMRAVSASAAFRMKRAKRSVPMSAVQATSAIGSRVTLRKRFREADHSQRFRAW